MSTPAAAYFAAAARKQYFCYQCNRTVLIPASAAAAGELSCPDCRGDFLEEVTVPAPTFIPLPFPFPLASTTIPAASAAPAPGSAQAQAPAAGSGGSPSLVLVLLRRDLPIQAQRHLLHPQHLPRTPRTTHQGRRGRQRALGRRYGDP